MTPPRTPKVDVSDVYNARRPDVIFASVDDGASTDTTAAETKVDPPPAKLPLTAAEIIRSPDFSRPRRAYLTGIPELDTATGGLRSRQQSLVAAPTGVGKTGLVGTIMRGLAQSGVPIFWLCTELDAEEQAARFAAIVMRSTRGGCVTPDGLLRHDLPVEQVAQVVDGLPLHVVRWRRSIGDPFVLIHDNVSAMAQKYGQQPIIVVDYQQKLAVEDLENRRQSVGMVSERLLGVAQDLDTHVLSISSVSRAYYNATARKLRKQNEDEDPRDWLAACKESGDLEYDAALMMFLDVGDDANAVGERPARLIVAKARSGGEGFFGLRFHGPSGLFVPDTAAANEMKAGKQDVVAANLDKIKVEVRRLVMRRKTPFTSRSAIQDRIEGRKGDVLAAIDEMFEAGELEQDGQRKPITFVPPVGDSDG